MSYGASKPGRQSTIIVLVDTRWKCVSLETCLPAAPPLNFHVAQDRIELSGDPVCLVFWKHDIAVRAACFERLHYVRHIISMVANCEDSTGLNIALHRDIDTTGKDMGDWAKRTKDRIWSEDFHLGV
jgi:hypothetical protein